MKITPVKKQLAPKYPDQYSVQLDHLLLENRPLRWYATPVAGAVLSAVVMLGLAGCSNGTTTTEDPTPLPAPGTETATMGGVAPPFFFKTPLFEHGDGIGVYGCDAVTAPIFLSEDDAFAIIKDEFEKLSLAVQQDDGTVTNVRIPKPGTRYSPDSNNSRMQTKKGTLEFDFAVQGRSIVMEYVSYDDMRTWGFDGPTTVSRYEYKEAARTLNTSLNRSYYEGVHGVFYDPAEYPAESIDKGNASRADGWEKTRAQLEEEARQRASDELRAQVKDFIEWLSAQGII